MPRLPPRAFAPALVLSLLAASAFADVSSADRAAAQGLFDQGRDLMTKGDFAQACPRLEESQRLDPGQGTQFNLAKCYEGLGRTTTAWTLYLELADAAKASGQADREKIARQRAEAVAPRVARLKIDVPDALGAVEVKRDGAVVGRGQWSAPIPIDPGKHTVTASAPGKRTFQAVVDVKEGQTGAVTIGDMPAETTHAPVVSAAPTATQAPPEAPPAPAEGGMPTQKKIAIAAGAVGVVGLALGTVFGLGSKSKKDEAAGHCDGGNACDDVGFQAKTDAVSKGNLATVFFAVGIVGVGGGAALWLTAPSSKSTGLRFSPRIGTREAGMFFDRFVFSQTFERFVVVCAEKVFG